MAIVTIKLEDCEEGVKVHIESDPPFVKDMDLTDAQEMGMGFMMSLDQSHQHEHEHVHGEHCNHEH